MKAEKRLKKLKMQRDRRALMNQPDWWNLTAAPVVFGQALIHSRLHRVRFHQASQFKGKKKP